MTRQWMLSFLLGTAVVSLGTAGAQDSQTFPTGMSEFAREFRASIEKNQGKPDVQDREGRAIIDKWMSQGLVLRSVMDNAGGSVLHYAVPTGNVPLVEYLISKGADSNYRGEFGLAPLHMANTGPMVKLLVEKNAFVDATHRDSRGSPGNDKTPLHYAASGLNPQTTLALLESGASVSSKGRDQLTPMADAALAAVSRVDELARRQNPPASPGVVLDKFMSTVELLLAAGGDIKDAVEAIKGLPESSGKTHISDILKHGLEPKMPEEARRRREDRLRQTSNQKSSRRPESTPSGNKRSENGKPSAPAGDVKGP